MWMAWVLQKFFFQTDSQLSARGAACPRGLGGGVGTRRSVSRPRDWGHVIGHA